MGVSCYEVEVWRSCVWQHEGVSCRVEGAWCSCEVSRKEGGGVCI